MDVIESKSQSEGFVRHLEDTWLHQQHKLCSKCTEIDWRRILTPNENRTRLRLLRMEHVQGQSCEFCRFLARVISSQKALASGAGVAGTNTPDDLSDSPFSLDLCQSHTLTLALQQLDHRIDRRNDKTVLASVGYIGVHAKNHQSCLREAETVKERIDYSLIRTWLSSCVETHTECLPETWKQIEGFRLIDCVSRHVILASTLGSRPVSYIALSYVW